MRQFAVALVSAVILVGLVLAQIPPAPLETVWEGMYAPPYLTNPQIATDMACASSSSCYLSGVVNGAGFGMYKYDGGFDTRVTEMTMNDKSMLGVSVAVGKPATGNETGVVVAVTIFFEFQDVSYLKGNTWQPSLAVEPVWAGTSVASAKNGLTYVAVGAGMTTTQLLISRDGGAAFANLGFPYKGDPTGCSFAQNIDITSDNVWYLTYSNKPNNNSNTNAKYHSADERVVATKAMGKVLIIQNTKTKEYRQHVKTWMQHYADLKEDRVRAEQVGDSCNFLRGEILKSTDQGKTWTSQFKQEGIFMSFVVCGDEKHCTVIGQGNENTYTITTTDGENWKITYTSPMPTHQDAVGVNVVGYASPSEVWAAGSQESQAAGKGIFWSSTNGGESWTPYKHYVPEIMVVMAMDFADGVGFALGMTAFHTAQIMRYKKQADYGLFVQSHCPVKGCTLLCENITYPQGMCLSANSGSIKAFCTPDGIKQYAYETTSCVGSYKTYMQPINQCLNSTNTFFKNYCPGNNEEFKGRRATSRDLLQ